MPLFPQSKLLEPGLLGSLVLFLGVLGTDAESATGEIVQSPAPVYGQQRKGAVDFSSTQGVMKRLGIADQLKTKFESCEKAGLNDQYTTEVKDNTLHVKASSPTSACRAVYDYMKHHGYGFVSWAGNSYRFPETLTDEAPKTVVSPVALRTHFNICDFGYTMAYWGWERWEKELDWMALRGINMPLALIGSESIALRVWKKMGMTDKEAMEFYTGPAHLPWHRMGNIAQMGGPIPEEWFGRQIDLQHKILNRMRELEMKPICSAFSGFVPRAITRLYPDIRTTLAGWVNRPEWARPLLLSAESPLFFEIGKMFMKEWEKEFGKGEYYLADMFNEQELPIKKDDPGYYEYMARCGETGYKAATVGNPDAVWVMQGWILNYQRNIWDKKTVEAFMSRIPKDKYIFIDLGTDWNELVWKNGFSYDVYEGFYDKYWMYSVVPNMGGRTIHTGVLDYYAKGHTKALNSIHKNNLIGFGNATEAIECQEIINELFFDASWTHQEIDLQAWLENYATNRYGSCPSEIKEAYTLLKESAYGQYGGSINWGWQSNSMQKGFINTDEKYLQALETFAKAAPTLKDSPLYQADLLEFTAMYVGCKMQYASSHLIDAVQLGNETKAEKCFSAFAELGRLADELLNEHPYMNLRNWVNHARSMSTNKKIQDYYENDARILIGTWGTKGTVLDDYAGKYWGGMMESFYLPRWREWLDVQLKKREPRNMRDLDFEWTENYLSGVKPKQGLQPDQVVALCEKALKTAQKVPSTQDSELPILAHWNPQTISTKWKTVSWNIPQNKLQKLKGIRFRFTSGAHRLEIRKVMVETDGTIVAEKAQNGKASNSPENNVFTLSLPKNLQGNNSCSIHAEIRTDGGTKSYGNVELILDE